MVINPGQRLRQLRDNMSIKEVTKKSYGKINKYDRINEWKYFLSIEEQLGLCPFCEVSIEPQPIVFDSELSIGEIVGVRHGCRVFIEGIVIRGDKVIYTSSYEFEEKVRYGRPSCEKCDSVEKCFKKARSLGSLRPDISPSKIYRESRIKETRSGVTNRKEIYMKENGICHICNEPVEIDNFHLEHIIPVSRGGTHTPENLKIAHPECNYKKGNWITLEEKLQREEETEKRWEEAKRAKIEQKRSVLNVIEGEIKVKGYTTKKEVCRIMRKVHKVSNIDDFFNFSYPQDYEGRFVKRKANNVLKEKYELKGLIEIIILVNE